MPILIVSAGAPLTCRTVGNSPTGKRTLLRTPGHSFALVCASGLMVVSCCTTSIQPSDERGHVVALGMRRSIERHRAPKRLAFGQAPATWCKRRLLGIRSGGHDNAQRGARKRHVRILETETPPKRSMVSRYIRSVIAHKKIVRVPLQPRRQRCR